MGDHAVEVYLAQGLQAQSSLPGVPRMAENALQVTAFDNRDRGLCQAVLDPRHILVIARYASPVPSELTVAAKVRRRQPPGPRRPLLKSSTRLWSRPC